MHELLTIREAAGVLRQTERSVRDKVGRGEIPSLRVGVGPRAPIRIVRADLDRWLYAPPPKPPVSLAAPGVGPFDGDLASK